MNPHRISRWLATALLALVPPVASAVNYCPATHFALQNASLSRADEFTSHDSKAGSAPFTYTPGFGAEQHIFGYFPHFRANGFAWSGMGAPVARDHDLYLQSLQPNGNWTNTDIAAQIRPQIEAMGYTWGSVRNPFGTGPSAEERVVFTQNCELFTVANGNRGRYSGIGSDIDMAFLLHSVDLGQTWHVYPIPGSADPNLNVRIEYSSQPGWVSGPPALLIHQHYDEQDGTLQTPRSLTLVTVDEAIPGQLTLSAAIPVASDNIGADLHSGEGGSLVTIGSKIHIVFAVPNPTSGTDEFVATYNKTTRAFETGQHTVTYPGNPLNAPRVLLATMPNADGSSVADDHDQPAIGRDSQNYLHVVLGGHHVDFKYLKSLAANSSTSGWSLPVLVGVQSGGANYNEYSYPSLTFDQYDNLYVAARWMDGSYTARLVVMKKAAASSAFSPLTTLVTASRPGYGVWYHKMSVDPWSRLWLSYEYMPDYLSTTGNPSELSQYAALLSVSYGHAVTLTPEICGAPPCADDGLLPLPAAALVSNDLGATWRLATTYDFY